MSQAATLPTELWQASPEAVLRQALSTRPLSPAVTSIAATKQDIIVTRAEKLQKYPIIGLGTCGTVFEIPGTEFAFKKGPDDQAILNDYHLTNQANAAVTACKSLFAAKFPDLLLPRAPACHEYHTATSDAFWEQHLANLPKSHKSKASVFQVDRIQPVPQIARHALISLYFEDDDEIQAAARKNSSNDHCLIRVYLGERESQEDRCYDDLRNFPLYLNMMEDLGLDVNQYAREMALGLAVLHWRARTDAMDTEFVIGKFSTPSSKQADSSGDVPAHSSGCMSDIHLGRATHLWMLDFDKAHKIELTASDVERYLVPAFRGNDPYFPQPQTDAMLWRVFGETYLEASRLILENINLQESESKHILALPQQFLDGVEASAKRAAEWDAEHDIVFG